NSRLRPYLARLHRQTCCYSQSLEMLEASIRLLIYYLKYRRVPVPI
ncbi:MAG: IS1 family transposase, partial [Cyanobacteria bacterium QS_9_48_30]